MRLALAAFVLALPVSAIAASVTVEARLPFKIEVGKIYEEQAGSTVYSAIDVTVTNGTFPLNEVLIHCDAGNKAGFTWNVTGQALNMDKGEKRSFRLLSKYPLDEVSRNGDRAKCLVSSYKIATF